MEGAKSAMYAQAGRNRGWTTVTPAAEETAVKPVTITSMAEAVPEPKPEAVPEPAPILILDPPVVELPDFMEPHGDCSGLAMAYVHMQKWQELYEAEQGFQVGTIFAELDMPFMGKGACKDE